MKMKMKYEPVEGIVNEKIPPQNIEAGGDTIVFEQVTGRNLQGFVEDLLSDGRTKKQIIAVARATHWHHRVPEIKEILKTFKNIKK